MGGMEWREVEGKGPAVSPFNLALHPAESLRRGAPPQVEETQPLCLHPPFAERYFLSGLFQFKEKSHPRLGFSKIEVLIKKILLETFQIPL